MVNISERALAVHEDLCYKTVDEQREDFPESDRGVGGERNELLGKAGAFCESRPFVDY